MKIEKEEDVTEGEKRAGGPERVHRVEGRIQPIPLLKRG